MHSIYIYIPFVCLALPNTRLQYPLQTKCWGVTGITLSVRLSVFPYFFIIASPKQINRYYWNFKTLLSIYIQYIYNLGMRLKEDINPGPKISRKIIQELFVREGGAIFLVKYCFSLYISFNISVVPLNSILVIYFNQLIHMHFSLNSIYFQISIYTWQHIDTNTRKMDWKHIDTNTWKMDWKTSYLKLI